MISVQELKNALESRMSEDQISETFRGLDYDKSGQIHYKEFLAAALESRNLVTEERLLEAFDRMDSDNSGVISR